MIEYKCPACGGAMEFDSATQKMKCPFCDTVMDVAEYQSRNAEEVWQTQDSGSGTWEALGTEGWQEGETDGMRVYSCESCGGEIVADENTGAASCPFCGNRVVMQGQFSGDLRPDFVIPFQKDKKAAKAAYYKHLEGKAFLPKVFRDENHIDEIKGVYVPFWVFDVDAEARISYRAERVRRWVKNDTEYTETQHFHLHRAGSIRFEHVPADCSKKMDDLLMESIEPYDFSQAVPFQPAYLAGYVADRYDLKMEDCIGRATARVKRSVEAAFRDTVQGYHMVTPQSSEVDMSDAKYRYVLYPVWILNTTWDGQRFTFAMNGQTGKMVGDLPADKSAFWKYVASRGVIIGAVIYLLMWLFTVI